MAYTFKVIGRRPAAEKRPFLRKVLRWLRNGGEGKDADGMRVAFNMETWGSDIHKRSGGPFRYDVCGTACCIGGYMDILNKGSRLTRNAASGLDTWQSTELFTPREYKLSGITAAQAAICLAHVIATGTVDWPRAKRIDRVKRSAA